MAVRSVFRPKYVAIFPGLGTGAGSSILSALDLGVKSAYTRRRSSFSTQLGIPVYFGGCPDDGVLRRYANV